jgi:hypothetical protein
MPQKNDLTFDAGIMLIVFIVTVVCAVFGGKRIHTASTSVPVRCTILQAEADGRMFKVRYEHDGNVHDLNVSADMVHQTEGVGTGIVYLNGRGDVVPRPMYMFGTGGALLALMALGAGVNLLGLRGYLHDGRIFA